MGAEFYQRLFSASLELIIWFLSFSLLILCITLVDLYIFFKKVFTFGCAGSLLLCEIFSSCGKQRLLSRCGV